MNLEGFLAPVRAEEIARMLAEWQWLPIRGLMPVGLTLLGDVILLGRDGSVHFVDTSFGVLERIADSDAQLRHRLDSEEGFATALLRSDLVDAMRSVDVITTVDREGIRRGKVSELPAGSIFGFAVPLIAGGRPDASNVLVTSAAVYLDGLGQLTRGAVSLSPGTEFRVAFEQFPDPEPPPPGARRRRLVRAARDRAPLRSPR